MIYIDLGTLVNYCLINDHILYELEYLKWYKETNCKVQVCHWMAIYLHAHVLLTYFNIDFNIDAIYNIAKIWIACYIALITADLIITLLNSAENSAENPVRIIHILQKSIFLNVQFSTSWEDLASV